jgi:CRISPR/Cas system CSM-associated protein Csm3 (group 7 of RAMP superfamily)
MSFDNARPQPVQADLDLTIQMIAPLSVGAAGSRGGMADKPIQRDAWNRPIIPGSQIKGRIRHACERLARMLEHPVCHAPYPTMCPYDSSIHLHLTRQTRERLHRERVRGTAYEDTPVQCLICALFGSSLYPSPLAFGDAIHQPPLQGETPPTKPLDVTGQLRPGVGLDRWRRTAQEEIFYTIETTDAGIILQSRISGRWDDTPADEVRSLVALLTAGARLSRRWGGSSSRGLGWAVVTVQARVAGEALDPQALLEEVPLP